MSGSMAVRYLVVEVVVDVEEEVEACVMLVSGIVVDEVVRAADVLDVVPDVEVVVKEELEAAVVLVSDVFIPSSEFTENRTPIMTTAAIIRYSVFMPLYL